MHHDLFMKPHFCFLLGTVRGQLRTHSWDFLGGPVVKNLPANAGDTGSIPVLGTKTHMPGGN